MEALPLRAGGGMEEIIDRYQNMVYGLALTRTGCRADADDVFQEVFLAYCQCGKTFRDEEHRKAWLLRTTINQCRRVTSSSWRKKTVPLSEREDAPVQFQEPEENRVWEALQNLAGDYRLPIYLFYFQELSTQEIAKILAIRPGTVRMRLTRGREQLRDALKGDYFDESGTV
ncbi:sigma-70 family RNA polymerase sigma factor [Pseudoflavonifractor sp. 60]|uniref:RNA polymerase sigma factor n=1 Tax=Pseudoflavonifractor sp. 60 TaxID=2304576 RepID=UPI001FACAD49|nr:sigma-70 family RNA polymerase sigma factor [Pseudoflavonifractor sp. 60]